MLCVLSWYMRFTCGIYIYVCSIVKTLALIIFKPSTRAAEGCAHLVSWNCFVHMSVCVCLCVCLRALIASGVIWCDIGRMWLVKPALQLFRILPSINWKGVVLVTQHIVHDRQRCQSWHSTSHRRRHINYLAVATRQNALVIKVSRQIHSNEFKRRLGFSFTVGLR